MSPTHLIVLLDIPPPALPVRGAVSGHCGPLTANDVQKLSYKLTHLYFNWPGTVRVPAPVQYAHKMVREKRPLFFCLQYLALKHAT